MGLWSRLFGDGSPAPEVESPSSPAALDTAPELPPDVGLLMAIGQQGGPDVAAAMAALGRLRASPFEGRALDELSRISQSRVIPEPVAVAMAAALVDRGDPQAALVVLRRLSSSSALLLRADLEAHVGGVALALTLAEKVLARDIDEPGARERRLRWRAALGLDAARLVSPDTATVALAQPEGPYSLLREVARGGSGAVYEAHDRELGRRVAFKIYHEPARDRGQLEHEARMATLLAGPGVVRVFEVQPDHGWLALEWASMGALRERIAARDVGTLSPLSRWALPLCVALARVHEAGFVHLDVKPANVLLVPPNVPLIADFGTARRVGEASPPGSRGYVSPERAAGCAADPRDDVFGFGRIVVEVLAALGPTPVDSHPWTDLAGLCTGPASRRPEDGRALATYVRERMA